MGTQHYLRRAPDYKLTLHMGDVIVIFGNPITWPAPSADFFVATPQMLNQNKVLQGGHKKRRVPYSLPYSMQLHPILRREVPLHCVSKGTKQHQ